MKQTGTEFAPERLGDPGERPPDGLNHGYKQIEKSARPKFDKACKAWLGNQGVAGNMAIVVEKQKSRTQ